jgi:hypothetical protein
MVVGIFVAITAFMAIFPLFSTSQVALQAYGDYFAKTASVYTGIVGVIVGYYFGRSQERGRRADLQDGQEPQSTDHGGDA